jgi:hypothetical protein
MKDEHAEKIIEQLDTMNCRLSDISHFLNEIETYGFLNRELIDAIIAIARAQSKEFDDEYKKQLNMKPYEV